MTTQNKGVNTKAQSTENKTNNASQEESQSFFQKHKLFFVLSIVVSITHVIGLPATVILSILYFTFSSWLKSSFKIFSSYVNS